MAVGWKWPEVHFDNNHAYKAQENTVRFKESPSDIIRRVHHPVIDILVFIAQPFIPCTDQSCD